MGGVSVGMIRDSFASIKPRAHEFADLFYENLFSDYAELKPLFASVDMEQQKKALIGSLVAAVDNLDNPDHLTRYLLALGQRHVRYGVEFAHYDLVGATLLKTLAAFCSEGWEQGLKEQWTLVYGVVSEAMKAGASKMATVTKLVSSQSKTSEAQVSTEVSRWIKDCLKDQRLPDSLRSEIRAACDQEIESWIKNEIRACLDERLQHFQTQSSTKRDAA